MQFFIEVNRPFSKLPQCRFALPLRCVQSFSDHATTAGNTLGFINKQDHDVKGWLLEMDQLRAVSEFTPKIHPIIEHLQALNLLVRGNPSRIAPPEPRF